MAVGRWVAWGLVVVSLAGCVNLPTHKRTESLPVAGPSAEIYERYTSGIRRVGFSHEVRLVRENSRQYDVITVTVPLDALTRRHESLDRVLRVIGEVAAAHDLPTLIDLQATREEDLEYMQAKLMFLVARHRHVQLHLIAEKPQTRIVIMVAHGKPGGVKQ